MKLNVSLIHQSKENHCGVSCIEMILNFYNIKYDNLDEKIELFWWGSYIFDWGKLLKNYGFDVLIKCNDNKTFKNMDKNLNEIHDKVNQYTKSGGIFELGQVTEEDITSSIDNKNPIIALVDLKILYDDENNIGGHCVVIKGIDDKYVYINDPSKIRNNDGRINKNRFFKAFYSYNSGYILFCNRP